MIAVTCGRYAAGDAQPSRYRCKLDAAAAIDAVLDRFGRGALRLAATSGVKLIHLRGTEAYRDRSRALRRLASGVDDWPVPPAGLFVVEERAVYLRSTSPMTVAHEFAHARVIFSSTLSKECQPLNNQSDAARASDHPDSRSCSLCLGLTVFSLLPDPT